MAQLDPKIAAFLPRLDVRGSFHLPVVTMEAREAAANLLYKNHTRHSCFFNDEGFHNHLVHHALAALALGANAKRLDQIYEMHASYQLPLPDTKLKDAEELQREETWNKCVGKAQYYHDFLNFFDKEVSEHGIEKTFNAFLLEHNPRAEDMLNRLYAGFLHPFIHVGYGIEFAIPGVLAEGLAMTAVHSNDHGPFFDACATVKGDGSAKMKDLLTEAQKDSRLDGSALFSDPNKVRGIFKRAMGPMTQIAGRFRASPTKVGEKALEVIDAASAIFAGAHRLDKILKFDFFIMHCNNSSVFLNVFINQPWVKDEDKVRLTERLAWLTITMYVSRARPPLQLDAIRNFDLQTKSDWVNVWDRALAFDDDGHAIKAVRAAANGNYVSNGKTYGMIDDDMWCKIGAMTMKSVEHFPDANWVRSTGFAEAWEKIPANL